jgi:alanyl-tRNA synthetase
LANKIISEDRKIEFLLLTKEEVSNIKEIRIKLDRIKSEKIRVAYIDGFDYSACTGTHAASTGFVGNILITKFVMNHGSYELRFKTKVFSDLFEYAKAARLSASILGIDISSLLGIIEKITKEKEMYKEKYRDIAGKLPVEFVDEKISDVTFKSLIVEGFDRKKLIDKINENLKEKTVICVINKEDGKANVMLSCSKELDKNIPDILREVLSKFNGKGGGRDNFAQGSVDEKIAEEIIEEIKNKIT